VMLSHQAFENREIGSFLFNPVDRQRQQRSQRSGNEGLVMTDQAHRPIAGGIAWCAPAWRQNDQPALLELQQQRVCSHVFDAARAVAPIPHPAQNDQNATFFRGSNLAFETQPAKCCTAQQSCDSGPPATPRHAHRLTEKIACNTRRFLPYYPANGYMKMNCLKRGEERHAG